MTTFTYLAINEDNKEIKGSVEALNLDAATAALKEQNLEVVEIGEAMRTRTDEPATVAASVNPSLKTTFAFEGTDAMGKTHRGVVEADTKYQAFERLKREQKLLLTMLSPLGITPQYRDNDLQNWQRKEMMSETAKVPSTPAPAKPPLQTVAPPPTPSQKVLRPIGFSLPESPTKSATPKPLPAPKSVTSYAPILATIRLYAGWLLAWYGLFVTIGYYGVVRTMPVDIPFVQAFFASPLIFSCMVAMFLFLSLETVHRTMKGGMASGIALTLVGVAAFVGFRMNI